MFKTAFLLALCSAVANGFAVVRPDASMAVQEAMKTTATFGIDSREAQVAWDIVEEINASDNSEATKAGLDKECEIEMASPECVDYGQFLEQLNVIRSSLDHFENKKRTLKDALKSIQITAGASSKAKSSPKLTEALEAAKKATAEFGVTSVEARLAWEDYEEIASSGLDNAMGVSLADECSLESGQAACQAIEEMDRVMAVLLAVSESK